MTEEDQRSRMREVKPPQETLRGLKPLAVRPRRFYGRLRISLRSQANAGTRPNRHGRRDGAERAVECTNDPLLST